MSGDFMDRRPHRVGLADVLRVEAETRTFRALDYRYGGGWCHDAVVAQLSWGYRLLEAQGTERVKAKLAVALGDLTSLVGWTAFDAGDADAAHGRFTQALELAGNGGDNGLVANILYRRGRVHLHHDSPQDALFCFEQAEHAAEIAGSAVMRSVLFVNQAWACAKMGRRDDTLRLLGRASEAFEQAGTAEPPVWARFFDETDLTAMTGTVYTELALTVDASYASPAIAELSSAVDGYGRDMARSQGFCLVLLSLAHLLCGEIDEAGVVGERALRAAEGLNSARFTDRLRPLADEAIRRRDQAGARELAERIAVFAAA